MKAIVRSLAIMFTDIVGYTRMMGRDEQKTLRVLSENLRLHESCISAYGGSIVKEMGDGIMAQFDNSTDAVNCAIDIQRECQNFDYKIRIGIHTGVVTIIKNDLYGHNVNVAARIESVADPGGIYITQTSKELITKAPNIKVKYIGEIALKNVLKPVKTWAVEEDFLTKPNSIRIRELTSKAILTSLAVMPIKSHESGQEQQYMIDGIQNALIGELAQIDSLRVISRTSTLRYSDSTLSVPEIADELKVDGLVEATIVQANEIAHIQVQLIKAFPKEKHLWSGRYKKNLKDILTIYNDVVRDITHCVKVRLTPKESKHLERSDAVVPNAYKAYLKGLFHWQKLSENNLEIALKEFELSKKLDPVFAPAHSGIAGIWIGRMIMGYIPSTQSISKIYAALRETRRLDENNADSFFWNAVLNVWIEWDWNAGLKAFQQAININSNHSLALAYYSHLLLFVRNLEESQYQIERSINLDPFNSLTQSLWAMQLNYSRQHEKAMQVLEKMLQERRNHPVAMSTLRSVYHNCEMYDKAYEIFRQSYIEKGDIEAADVMQAGYYDGGYKNALIRTAELLSVRSVGIVDNLWQRATLYARADEEDLALDFLEKAFEVRDPNMPYISIDPIFDKLSANPRFKNLMTSLEL